jgi:hypothetical protein
MKFELYQIRQCQRRHLRDSVQIPAVSITALILSGSKSGEGTFELESRMINQKGYKFRQSMLCEVVEHAGNLYQSMSWLAFRK